MNVLYSTDENYSKICLASLTSLLDNNKKSKINIYIIDNNISKDTKKIFSELEKKYKQKIIYIKCEEICKDLIKKNDFPISAYARLFIQDSIIGDKIIYIDCDTIICNSLAELWNVNIDSYMVGGIIDPLPNYLKSAVEMRKDDMYINSGVLLINLKKWRELNFKEMVIKYLESHDYNVMHHDQGIINGLCSGNILYLDIKYNLMPEYIMMTISQLNKLYGFNISYSEKERKNAVQNPTIIHFIRKFYNRPWFKECTHPLKDKFIVYYSGKYNFELESKSLNKKVKIRKYIFEHLPFNFYVFFEKAMNIIRTKKVQK